jgi:TrmH family RNA methyltransferase
VNISNVFKRIDSTSNPQVKWASGLYHKKNRDLENVFMVEGERLFKDGLSSRHPFKTIYVTQKLSLELRASLISLKANGTEVFEVSEEIIAKISSTRSPQGIVGVAHQIEVPIPESADLLLVLDGVGDPGNAGTLLRSAEAAGANAAVFLQGSVDPYHEKVVRSGMGAHFRLPIKVMPNIASLEAAFPSLCFYLADIHGSSSYTQVNWCSKAALIIGGEANGASIETKKKANSVYIDMKGPTESLNAAMAGSIVLFEAARQRRVQRDQ